MLTQTEALTRALALAILAQTDANARRASDLAEDIARGLAPADVARCKRDAQQMVRQALQKAVNQ